MDNSLDNKSLEELKAIAKELGIKVHHRAKENSIKYLIEQQGHRVENAVVKAEEKSVEEKKEVGFLTKQEVMDAIRPVVENKEAFKVKFLDDDKTWFFDNNGVQDSGSMTMPIHLIVNKARIVSRGRYVLRGLGRDRNDATYAGNILSAR